MVRHVVEQTLVYAPRRSRNGDGLILSYHNVVPHGSHAFGDRSLHLSADRFLAQLDVIRQEASIVSLMELLTTHAPRKRRAAITFDDAYASALSVGVAGCVSAGIPCTVFVAPALLNTVPVWDLRAQAGTWSDEERETFLWEREGRGVTGSVPDAMEPLRTLARIATVTELQSIASSPLVTLGNHTMHHPNLGALDPAAASAEVAACTDWLATLPNVQIIPVVAYPYGIPPRSAIAADFGLRVSGGWIRGAVRRDGIPRWNVPAGLSDKGFRARLRGWML